MAVTDRQVRKLMDELEKHGEIGLASLRAGMDRATGRKYAKSGKLPSELKKPRTYRTRENPFEEDWVEIEARLEDAPELEAKTLFDDLMARKPDRYEPGQLRTLQRQIRRWRALNGPEKEVFFEQEHRPGEAGQTDFTNCDELGITIQGEAFPHLLCHFVLPYSNWEWATACRSESMMALRRGVQAAVFRLGAVPEKHQTDNSTAATHDIPSGKRAFNAEYEALMRHLEMKPRTIGVGKSHQNGDVEALNGVLKRRLKQHLLLRGSRDFEGVATYEQWVQGVLEKANGLRRRRFEEEFPTLRPLSVKRLPEFTEERVPVGRGSTIRVKSNTYSVPSRLRGERVVVRIFDDRLEVYLHGVEQLRTERLLGRGGCRIDYRHVIGSLVRRTGAFRRYRYREELFPSLVFRQVYDRLVESRTEWRADVEYLRLLHLAATTLESEVEAALELLLAEGRLPLAATVKELMGQDEPTVPELEIPEVDLATYDALLGSEEEEWA